MHFDINGLTYFLCSKVDWIYATEHLRALEVIVWFRRPQWEKAGLCHDAPVLQHIQKIYRGKNTQCRQLLRLSVHSVSFILHCGLKSYFSYRLTCAFFFLCRIKHHHPFYQTPSLDVTGYIPGELETNKGNSGFVVLWAQAHWGLLIFLLNLTMIMPTKAHKLLLFLLIYCQINLNFTSSQLGILQLCESQNKSLYQIFMFPYVGGWITLVEAEMCFCLAEMYQTLFVELISPRWNQHCETKTQLPTIQIHLKPGNDNPQVNICVARVLSTL